MMIRSQAPLRVASQARNILIYCKRCHSSSSSIPPAQPDQTKENNNNNKLESNDNETIKVEDKTNSNEASSTETSSILPSLKTPTKAIKINDNKKPITVKSETLNFPYRTLRVSYDFIPTVPSTQYLDTAALKKDMFYGGYRPLLTPIRKPVIKSSKNPTIPLSWNVSACKLESFDDYANVPQFVVDKLTPFNTPPPPGNEIRLGIKSRKEQKEQERLSKEVLQFITSFKK